MDDLEKCLNKIAIMSLACELKKELRCQGADFTHFVDISKLSNEQNKKFPIAILFGCALSPEYIQKVTNTPDYVKKMVENNQMDEDEFHVKELFTDQLADDIAGFLSSKGYSAYSQSENNIYLTGFYDENRKSTPLPHKIIAGLAGLGWIGRHNLLVTPEYGSAISMCTVLTDAPLNTVLNIPVSPQCGDCNICKDVCPVKAIKGSSWDIGTSRDELVDVDKCNTCLKCLVFLPMDTKICEEGSSELI